MRLISCAFVIGAALSCSAKKESLVVLNITRAADVPPIASLQLQVGPVLKTLATPVPREGDTEPPLQLGIYVPASAKTPVVADVIGMNGQGCRLARGTASVPIQPGLTVIAFLSLSATGSCAADGGTGDTAIATDGHPDLAHDGLRDISSDIPTIGDTREGDAGEADRPEDSSPDLRVDTFVCSPVGDGVRAGMVGWWRGDGDAADSAGTNQGSLQNGASFAAGQIGQAFSLDGVDDFVSVGNTGALDFRSGDFSISLWFRLDSLVGDRTFVSKNIGVFPNEQAYLLEAAPSSLRFLVRDTTANENDLVSSISVSLLGQFHHVVGVRSGDTSRLYLDSVLLGIQTGGSNVDTGIAGSATIGRLAGAQANVRAVAGLIDDVRFYARALSAGEVADVFAGAQCR